MLVGTGCPIVVTCEDTGCPSSQVCNRESGVCEAIVRDCRTLDFCRSGEVCDEETGECRPERLRCTESFTCPQGQSCNASTGFCEPAFRCQSHSDCGVAEQCDFTTQQCVDRDCDDDADCPTAYVCGDDETCTAGCRPGAGGCPPRQFCSVLTGDSVGNCVPNCQADQDCPFGQFCDLTRAPESRCVNEGPCTVDDDCRLDEICADTACVQPPCVADEDCLDNQVCDTSTRTCRAGACTEDNFGAGTVPNHSRSTARTLDLGTYTQLVLCPGRADWFAIDARDTDVLRARLTQATQLPDLDLYLYDGTGQLVARNQQTAPVSTIKYAAGRDQVLYLEVRATSFASATYDLSLGADVCANDPFEENDRLEEATVVPSSIGLPTELQLRACGFDEDWFRLRQNSPDAGLRIERVLSTSDLVVDLFLPDGEQFAIAPDEPFLALRTGATGSAYVRAYGVRGQSGSYRLAFETLDPWQCPDAGAHASAETAIVAEPTGFGGTLCPLAGAWEVDWIELVVTEPGILDAQVRALDGAPPLDIVLWSGDGVDNTLVRAAARADGVSVVQAAVEPGPRWFLRVSSASNLGRVLDEPRYDLEYLIR